jgi:hypothetical protein
LVAAKYRLVVIVRTRFVRLGSAGFAEHLSTSLPYPVTIGFVGTASLRMKPLSYSPNPLALSVVAALTAVVGAAADQFARKVTRVSPFVFKTQSHQTERLIGATPAFAILDLDPVAEMF